MTNIIKIKKSCNAFIEIKAILLEEKLYEKDNNYLLRKRHFQIRKDYKIKELKEKIIRCIEFNIQKEKYLTDNYISKEDEKNYDKKEMNKIEEKIKKNIDNYNIYFYLLEKDKKDILMEICISLSNNLQKYESIFILNIPIISEENFLSNILSKYDMNKYILIIEIQKKILINLFLKLYQ